MFAPTRGRRFLIGQTELSTFTKCFLLLLLCCSLVQQANSGSFFSYNPKHDDELYSGPYFEIEPGLNHKALPYSNWTQATIHCKVNGYPRPTIRWRVDNVTINTVEQSDDSFAVHYWPSLNSLVSIRNEGQTLTIGGQQQQPQQQQQQSDSNRLVGNYRHTPVQVEYASANYHHHHSTIISHQIECLATNHFGSIISRSVAVQQVFHDGSYQPPVATTIGRKQPKPLQPVGGAYRPQAGDWQSVQPITVQLYDEFVARGNVAVLKCLINMPTADPAGSPLAPAAKVTYHNSQFHTAQHLEFVQQNFLFEWQVKSGPATSVSVRELITTLRSNQTQGKYTAYPSGELHVRDVEEHDARRTYQCVVARRQPKAESGNHRNPSSAAAATGSINIPASILPNELMSNSINFHPIESTFAQIILSGSEKDVFPPRIIHRTEEIFAQDGQLESLLIACAAHAQPLPQYKWYWIPFGIDFDWETEIASLLLRQKQKPGVNSFAYSIPTGSERNENDELMLRQLTRRQQISLGRVRSYGSTLLLPGPIGQSNSGHYVAIVSNSVGYDRCISTVNVRSSLSVVIVENVEQWKSNSSLGDSSAASGSSSRRQPLIRAVRGDTVQLKCIVNGFPLADVRWLHNTLAVTSGQATKTSNEHYYHYNHNNDDNFETTKSIKSLLAFASVSGMNVAEISAIKQLDLSLTDQSQAGMYQCFARNRFETIQATVQIMVIDQPPVIVDRFPDVTVQPGDFVMLRCTSRGSPLAQIEWSLDRRSIPNSARYRFGDFVLGTESSEIKSASLLVSHFNISMARVEDGGLYRCTAKNVAGTAYHEARVNVIGKGSVKVQTPNVTALSNSDIQLNCPYYGYPIQSIVWFGKDGSQRKLPVNGRQHISENGTLHISKVNKKEDECFYECEISQDGGHSARTRIFLKVTTGPRIDNFTFASNLEEGMRSVAVCAVISGDSPIRIVWLKDGVQLSPTGSVDYKIEMVNEFTSSITFTALKRRHVGRYTCIASNLASSDQHSADLKVNVAPIWLIEPKDIVAISGQMLVINCQAEGIPEPQIRWKVESSKSTSRNGSKYSQSQTMDIKSSNGKNSNPYHAVISNPHIQILENGSLIIKEVNKEDDRGYMCSAFNGVGSGISTIIHLSVRFPPEFVYGYYESKTAKIGESVVLTCLVKVDHIGPEMEGVESGGKNRTHYDDQLEMRWFKDEKLTTSGGGEAKDDHYHITNMFEVSDKSPTVSNYSTVTGSGVDNVNVRYYATKLTIRHVDRADTGIYLCTAQNPYGYIRKNFTLIILEAPDKPSDVRFDEVTSSTVKLSWLIPFDGNSAITEYTISFRAISSNAATTVTLSPFAFHSGSKFFTYHLASLTPNTGYFIQVKAKNSIGYGVFSDTITVKTAEEPPNEVPTEITILPLSTRSLKISWHGPRLKISSSSSSGGNTYVPPITGYYIGYRPHLEHKTTPIYDTASGHNDALEDGGVNEFVFKTIKSTSSLLETDQETFVLANLKRATRYDIKIQAFNQAGAGPSSSEHLGKTLDFDVPSAPTIRALKSNLSSIELMWSVQGDEPISGFVISYKIANQAEQPPEGSMFTSDEWQTIKIDLDPIVVDSGTSGSIYEVATSVRPISTFQRRTYVLSNLRCGTKYFLYVNAFNSAGQGDPSEVILSRTEGNVPITPESVQDFLIVNITTSVLNLSQWKRRGCPIDSFEINYRLYGNAASTQKYILDARQTMEIVNNSAEEMTSRYELANLTPGAWYELIVKANTEAGFIVREFAFATLATDGSTIAPLTLKALDGQHMHQANTFGGTLFSWRSTFFSQLHYIVPVSCTLFVLFLVTIVVCAIQTTNRNRFLLSFVAQRNRHKVSGKFPSSSIYECTTTTTEQSGSVMLHENIESSIGTTSGINYCAKEHIYSGVGKIPDPDGGRYQIRSDSCHSLGGFNTGEHIEPASVHFDTMKMLKSCNENMIAKNKPVVSQQYPLYSLPVPYATSAVKFAPNAQQVPEGKLCNYGPTEPVYGIGRCYQGQLNEMYCDNPSGGGGGGGNKQMVQLEEQTKSCYESHEGPTVPATQGGPSSRRGSGHYEMPFVFKVNHTNESTAF